MKILPPRAKRLTTSRILQDEGCALIALTKGFEAIIDIADFDEINQYYWSANVNGSYVRAYRTSTRNMIYLHQEVLGFPVLRLGQDIDHINGNALDNRRANLRIVTHAENGQNSVRSLNRVGVCYHRASSLWIAYISFPHDGRVSLGYWRTEDKAKEVVRLGEELYRTCKDKAKFKELWKKLRPRAPYDRGAM